MFALMMAECCKIILTTQKSYFFAQKIILQGILNGSFLCLQMSSFVPGVNCITHKCSGFLSKPCLCSESIVRGKKRQSCQVFIWLCYYSKFYFFINILSASNFLLGPNTLNEW